MTKKKNISYFLSAAMKYGVPDRYLFRPEDLAVQAHFYKYDEVTFVPCFIFSSSLGSPELCSPSPRWLTWILDTLGQSLTSTELWRISWTRSGDWKYLCSLKFIIFLFLEMIINGTKKIKKRYNSNKHSREFGGNHQFKTPSRCKQILTLFLPIWCK